MKHRWLQFVAFCYMFADLKEWTWAADLLLKPLIKDAWEHGFETALIEVSRNKAFMFTCMDRSDLLRRSFLYTITTRTIDAWDAGYTWAIIMHRMGIDLAQAKRCKSRWTTYHPLLEWTSSIATCILDGELKPDPRVWVARNGVKLYEMNRLEQEQYEAYRRYAETVQFLRNNPETKDQRELEVNTICSNTKF